MGSSVGMTSDLEPLDAMAAFPSASQLGGRISQTFDLVQGVPYFFNGFGCRSTLIWTNQIGIPK